MAFDASAIPALHIIRLPFQFTGETVSKPKWFVVVAHENGKAMCVKVTSRGAKFKDSAYHSDGWVWFYPGEIACLPKETAIQTENFFEISHVKIESFHGSGELSVEPTTDDCKSRILQAVDKSQRLSGREKERFKAWLT